MISKIRRETIYRGPDQVDNAITSSAAKLPLSLTLRVNSPVWVPGCNAPLIHLLISALYTLFACLPYVASPLTCCFLFVSDIAIFVLKRDVKLQLTNSCFLCLFFLTYLLLYLPFSLRTGNCPDVVVYETQLDAGDLMLLHFA